MRLHRFIGNFDLTQPALAITDSKLCNQIKNVLRLKINEHLILVNNNGDEARAMIKTIAPSLIQVTLDQPKQNPNEPTQAVTLYCAILKKENFEWVVQKATEVGVKTIVPITTKRTVKLGLRLDRLEKIIKEAAEQSGRGVVPVLHEIITFEQATTQAQTNTQNYFFSAEGGSAFGGDTPYDSVGIFIGPEGGWDPTELELVKNKNFTIASLGNLTLRAETAAIVASYLLTHPDIRFFR